MSLIRTLFYLLIVGVSGIGATYAAYMIILENEQSEARTVFMTSAADKVAEIKGLLTEEKVTMAAMSAFIENTPDIKQTQFLNVANKILSSQSALYYLVWAPKITHADVETAQAAWQQDMAGDVGFNDMAIDGAKSPLAVRDAYYPIYYIAPRDGAGVYLGTDIANAPRTRDTVRKVLQSGQAQATPKLDLMADRSVQPMTLILLPTMSKDVPGEPTGILLGAILLDKAINDTLMKFTDREKIQLSIYDISDSDAPKRIFHAASSADNSLPLTATDQFVYSDNLDMLGRQWQVTVKPVPGAFPYDDTPTQAIVVAGSLLTVLGLLITFLLATRHAAMKEQIDSSTRDLQQSLGDLAKARDDALAAAKTKADFLANMSHEIRTPLNGVLAAADLLIDTPLNGSQKNYVDIIHTSGDMLLSLINDILDYSKLNAGKMTLYPTVLEVSHATETLASIFRAQANTKKLSFAYSIDPPQHLHILADHLRLRQVAVNLIGNAIKYTQTGSVNVRLKYTRQEDRATMHFEVEDTGPGIPPAQQEHIFDKFTQLEKSGGRGGTGLGLAISRSLIDLMHGKIGVRSDGENGSVFWFEVPVVVIDDPSAFAKQAELKVDQAHDHKGCKVLLVEDVDTNRLVAREMLRRFGCEVDTATNGREAVECVQRGQYDIIFMDCQMPVMNGFDATRQIRQSGDSTVIVALTAHAFKEEIDRCLAVGMNDFVSKPINLEILGQTLDKWHTPVQRAAAVRRAGVWARRTVFRHWPPEREPPPVFDPQFLRDLCEAIPEKAGQIMDMAIKDTQKLYVELQNAVTARNTKEAGEIAHAMKSAVRQIGGEQLAHGCKLMEMAGKADDIAAMLAAFTQIQHAYPLFLKAIQDEAARLTFPPTHT